MAFRSRRHAHHAKTPSMVRLLVDARWIGPHGIGRFAAEILPRLPEAQALPLGWPVLHPFEAFALRRLLLRLRPRVYFTPGFNPPWRSPVPVVMTIYDLIHLHHPAESSALKRLYYRVVVRDAARRGAHILTPSEFSRHEILQWTGIPASRVTVVGCGVGPEFSPHGPRDDLGFPYLLHVGNHKPHKNLHRLLEAFSRLPTSWGLRLVLTGQLEADLVSTASRLGVRERLVSLATVPEEKLPALYRGAQAVVLPSLYEGFGLPALEAMACGTPVIAAATTALPEVVGEAAVLTEAYDSDAIAGAIRQVLEDEALQQRLAQLGPQRARSFDWEDVARRVRSVLELAAAE